MSKNLIAGVSANVIINIIIIPWPGEVVELLHIWALSFRISEGIHSCIVYLWQVNLAKPIPLQTKPKPISSNLKAPLDTDMWSVIPLWKPSALAVDFSWWSRHHTSCIHSYVAQSISLYQMAFDPARNLFGTLICFVLLSLHSQKQKAWWWTGLFVDDSTMRHVVLAYMIPVVLGKWTDARTHAHLHTQRRASTHANA